jgi:hypothetical protein
VYSGLPIQLWISFRIAAKGTIRARGDGIVREPH